jgi:hypothetical protein
MYETRAYDKSNNDGFPADPVVVLVATGTHDVSRLVYLLSRGNCEHVELAEQVRRQVARHGRGRAALRLLAEHGGPDLLTEVGDDELVKPSEVTDADVDRYAHFVTGHPGAEPDDRQRAAVRAVLDGLAQDGRLLAVGAVSVGG